MSDSNLSSTELKLKEFKESLNEEQKRLFIELNLEGQLHTDIEGDLHSDFWKGRTALPNCPICRKNIGKDAEMRTQHYIEFHYNVFYHDQFRCRKCDIEKWMLIKLGRKSGRGINDNRCCLICTDRRLFGGRRELLNHIKQEHREEFAGMQAEYGKLIATSAVDRELDRILQNDPLVEQDNGEMDGAVTDDIEMNNANGVTNSREADANVGHTRKRKNPSTTGHSVHTATVIRSNDDEEKEVIIPKSFITAPTKRMIEMCRAAARTDFLQVHAMFKARQKEIITEFCDYAYKKQQQPVVSTMTVIFRGCERLETPEMNIDKFSKDGDHVHLRVFYIVMSLLKMDISKTGSYLYYHCKETDPKKVEHELMEVLKLEQPSLVTIGDDRSTFHVAFMGKTVKIKGGPIKAVVALMAMYYIFDICFANQANDILSFFWSALRLEGIDVPDSVKIVLKSIRRLD